MKLLQEALGRIESRQLLNISCADFEKNEFKVYSQWGEDGLIQFLLQHVSIDRRIFVEFGVENYEESNTRFLLVNNNWSGVVIDGGKSHIAYVRSDPLYWRFRLSAVCAFVTAENINDLMRDNGVTGDIGLLSIDIDGNDYWVWKALDAVSARIVIVEYNSRFGSTEAVTVPYDPRFERRKAHHSMIYFGASLRAMVNLATAKGYTFIGCNTAGVNAFFVRNDVLGDLKMVSVDEGYRVNQFRESRDASGSLVFLTPEQESLLLQDLPLTHVSEH